MQTDMLNKPLIIGDYVFVTRKNYRDLVLARITKFTPKQIRVVYMASWSSSAIEEYLTGQVIKVEPQDLPLVSQRDREQADQAYEKRGQ